MVTTHVHPACGLTQLLPLSPERLRDMSTAAPPRALGRSELMNPSYLPHSVELSRKGYDPTWRFKEQRLKLQGGRKRRLSLFQLLTLPGTSIFMEEMK